jgi:hypothetical protein
MLLFCFRQDPVIMGRVIRSILSYFFLLVCGMLPSSVETNLQKKKISLQIWIAIKCYYTRWQKPWWSKLTPSFESQQCSISRDCRDPSTTLSGVTFWWLEGTKTQTSTQRNIINKYTWLKTANLLKILMLLPIRQIYLVLFLFVCL